MKNKRFESKEERMMFAWDLSPDELYEFFINPLLRVRKEDKQQILLALLKCNHYAETRIIRKLKDLSNIRGDNLMKCLILAQEEIRELQEEIKKLNEIKVNDYDGA